MACTRCPVFYSCNAHELLPAMLMSCKVCSEARPSGQTFSEARRPRLHPGVRTSTVRTFLCCVRNLRDSICHQQLQLAGGKNLFCSKLQSFALPSVLTYDAVVTPRSLGRFPAPAIVCVTPSFNHCTKTHEQGCKPLELRSCNGQLLLHAIQPRPRVLEPCLGPCVRLTLASCSLLSLGRPPKLFSRIRQS